MNYIDVNELVISSQDADNTYIALNEYGDIVRTKIAAGGGEGGYVDLSDYYTKSEVDKKIENIDTSEVDLSNYYTKQEINNKGFVTDSDVNDYVGNEIGQLEEIINTKQNQLVSGSNIKTVNGMSLLGSGNINIESGYVDWNAQEGEAGYIKNRTHYIERRFLTNVKINPIEWEITYDDTDEYREFGIARLKESLSPFDDYFIVVDCIDEDDNNYEHYKEVVLKLSNEWQYVEQGNELFWEIKIDNTYDEVSGDGGLYLMVRDIYGNNITNIEFAYCDEFNFYIKKIDEHYLPNTLLKTSDLSLYYTKTEIDGLIGDINNILESI